MTEPNSPPNHYALLKVKPTASPQQIRRAYRDLSKLYHPDTTELPPVIATEQFRRLNNAYATLSNPEMRTAYDYSIGISRIAVVQAPSYLNRPASERGKYTKDSAYLDPNDRPLSAGEMFALFILGLTFVGCLVLVLTVGWSKGELVLYSPDEPIAAESASLTESETESMAPAPEHASASSPHSPAVPHRLPQTELSPKII
ncbi:MAG: J domain-containing protein [Cyanobacteria bacterium P01_C01_bin.147]